MAGPVIDEERSMNMNQAKAYGNAQAAQFWKRRHRGRDSYRYGLNSAGAAASGGLGESESAPEIKLDPLVRLSEPKTPGEVFVALDEQALNFMKDCRPKGTASQAAIWSPVNTPSSVGLTSTGYVASDSIIEGRKYGNRHSSKKKEGN